MEAIEALRLSLGPGVVMNYTAAGLFHPARRVRESYWRIYNNMYLGSASALVAHYPRTETDRYHRPDLDLFL